MDDDDVSAGQVSLSLEQTEVLHGAREWSHDMLNALVPRIHPLLANVRRETFSDLPAPKEEGPTDGETIPAPSLFKTQTVSIEVAFSLSEPLHFEVDSFLARLYEMADQYGAQLSASMLDHIGEIAEANDMTVDGKGRDVFDVMMEALEKVEWGFDDEGKHQMRFVVGSDLYNQISELELTEQQERQIEELTERKRDAWNAARRRRTLP